MVFHLSSKIADFFLQNNFLQSKTKNNFSIEHCDCLHKANALPLKTLSSRPTVILSLLTLTTHKIYTFTHIVCDAFNVHTQQEQINETARRKPSACV